MSLSTKPSGQTYERHSLLGLLRRPSSALQAVCSVLCHSCFCSRQQPVKLRLQLPHNPCCSLPTSLRCKTMWSMCQSPSVELKSQQGMPSPSCRMLALQTTLSHRHRNSNGWSPQTAPMPSQLDQGMLCKALSATCISTQQPDCCKHNLLLFVGWIIYLLATVPCL